eukprot:5158265-Prymnesium_polylepis.2
MQMWISSSDTPIDMRTSSDGADGPRPRCPQGRAGQPTRTIAPGMLYVESFESMYEYIEVAPFSSWPVLWMTSSAGMHASSVLHAPGLMPPAQMPLGRGRRRRRRPSRTA